MAENMTSADQMAYQAVIIGGGFYGASVASYLIRKRGFNKVALLEQEDGLLLRASLVNQARIHNGYHYPRSFTTAFRSRINFVNFTKDWPDTVFDDFQMIYAIARKNSKVTAKQFERFCTNIHADIEVAPRHVKYLFEPRLIEESYLVKETAFNARRLASWAEAELRQVGVDVFYKTKAEGVSQEGDKRIIVTNNEALSRISTDYIFNCTYSGLNQLSGDWGGSLIQLKHEVTEMGLVDPPAELEKLGITVMDGPFFSAMPYPSENCYSVSHVRYTPHFSWQDDASVNPYERLRAYNCHSRFDLMKRDVSRFLPCFEKASYRRSMFEVKTVLVKNEVDDGRPILFERHQSIPKSYMVLGGKIDNIYDILQRLDDEPLEIE